MRKDEIQIESGYEKIPMNLLNRYKKNGAGAAEGVLSAGFLKVRSSLYLMSRYSMVVSQMKKVEVHPDHTKSSRSPHFYESLTLYKQLMESTFSLAKPFRRYSEMD